MKRDIKMDKYRASGKPKLPSAIGSVYKEVKYYPAFDYLRLLLAVTVAASHGGFMSWSESGGYAVQVFFALSGWLIGGILLRSKPKDLPRFYFNRAVRIWIPYFVAIILLMAASLLKEKITAKWLEIFFYDSTFAYNFFGPPQLALHRNAMPLMATGNHFWSICSEEQFYLLAPFLITMLPRRLGNRAWFWSLLSLVALACPYWGFFASISLGVLMSVSRATLGDWQTMPRARWLLGLFATSSFIATFMNLVAYRVAAPISAISIVLFLAQPGGPSSVASFVGGISFPMYLNAWIGGFAANSVFGKFGQRGTWFCRFSGIVFALLVASILYLLIDRTIRKARESYFSEFRGKVLASVGFGLVIIGITGGLLIKSY
jgi:peptidoglycan/LPS O-acetylase OafA/YrhL